MSLSDFVTQNLYNGDSIINALIIGFMFVIVYDFYHTITSAVFSLFKRN